jgi:hypothetical protein
MFNPFVADIITQRMDALIFAKNTIELASVDEEQQHDPVFKTPTRIMAMYVTKCQSSQCLGDENIFSPANLHAIRHIESEVLNHPEWTDYCLKDADGNCKPPLSVVNYMFPVNDTMAVKVPCPAVLPMADCQALAQAAGGVMPKQTKHIPMPPFDGEVFNGTGPLVWSIDNQLEKLIYPPEALALSDEEKLTQGYLLQFQTQFFLTQTPNVTFGSLTSNATRTLFQFGLPLKGYTSADDRREEQEAKAGAFTLKIVKEVLDKERLRLVKEDSAIELLYLGGDVVQSNMIQALLANDALLAIGSICFVYIYIWAHTGSLFLASFGMLHIILSFPVAYFFLNVVLGIRYFDMMNIFLIYIIMGIGADDVFVFMDALNQSKVLFPGDLSSAMAHALTRASKAMLVTSLTTTLAFLANVASPLMPSAQFGIFAAIMVMINYLMGELALHYSR